MNLGCNIEEPTEEFFFSSPEGFKLFVPIHLFIALGSPDWLKINIYTYCSINEIWKSTNRGILFFSNPEGFQTFCPNSLIYSFGKHKLVENLYLHLLFAEWNPQIHKSRKSKNKIKSKRFFVELGTLRGRGRTDLW